MAAAEGWISFSQLQLQFPSEQAMVKFISEKTMLTRDNVFQVSGDQKKFWSLFEHKIRNFFPLFACLHIFKRYMRYVFLKYVANGYTRIEFRALLMQLIEYDENGNEVRVHDESEYAKAMDEVYEQVKLQHPFFSFGVIFFGLKMWSDQQNFNHLDKACSMNWKHMIGIDFVNEEDPYGSMAKCIELGDKLLRKHSHLHLKKVYHAGETKDHLNNNVEQAVRAGSVRIGHGINIVKRIDFLEHCKHVCFEINPVSNQLTGAVLDMRNSAAPILLSLGCPVSISPDDPDHFVSAVSFNWTLQHFKLIAYHSINHAILTEGQKLLLLDNFHRRWDQWIVHFLNQP